MPIYMNKILRAISHRNIQCSFCYDHVLCFLGHLAINYDYASLLQLYVTEDSFVNGCIEHILQEYINYSLGLFDEMESPKNLTRKKFQHILLQCKEETKTKRSKRQQDENYLGKLSFCYELSRSLHEFLSVVTNTSGFVPYLVN